MPPHALHQCKNDGTPLIGRLPVESIRNMLRAEEELNNGKVLKSRDELEASSNLVEPTKNPPQSPSEKGYCDEQPQKKILSIKHTQSRQVKPTLSRKKNTKQKALRPPKPSSPQQGRPPDKHDDDSTKSMKSHNSDAPQVRKANCGSNLPRLSHHELHEHDCTPN